jgi:hypothetical protein
VTHWEKKRKLHTTGKSGKLHTFSGNLPITKLGNILFFLNTKVFTCVFFYYIKDLIINLAIANAEVSLLF